MKRAYPSNEEQPTALFNKSNTNQSFYIEPSDSFSIYDRIIHYKPTHINNKIAKELYQYNLIKKANLIPDFEINNAICIYVRTLEEYTKQPNEVFELSGKQKQASRENQYAIHIFILITNKDEMKSPMVEELSARCVFSEFTFILCWDVSSAATYINNIKIYEKRGSELIQKPPNKDLESQANYVLTSINGINKENARELMKKYRTISDIMTSSLDDLAEIPGLGNKRVLSIYQTFQQTKET